MNTEDIILDVDRVSKRFTSKLALDDVSLRVPRGTVYGLLGPNGAGKTTLLRIINHITAPDTGRVLFNGRQLTQDDVQHIGYLPEERGLYKKMKVGDQAMYFARLKGLSKEDARKSLQEWFDRFGIQDWWGRKVEELSKGMAQKVQFIVTVLHRPPLLIFDEPFSGFDPINANLLKEEIMALKDAGATIIFSTHNMASVEEVCDHITLINDGRNVLSGNVENLRREFFGNRYELNFNGDDKTLQASLEPFTVEVTPMPPSPEGLRRLSIKLKDSDARRPAIAAANSAVDLQAFAPALASMNQIFIRTVQSTRQNPEQ